MIKKLLMLMLSLIALNPAQLTTAQSIDSDDVTHKHFVYDVFYGSTKIGKINRDEQRQDQRYYVSLSADLSFLFLKLGGYQNSIIQWQAAQQWHQPVRFERRTKGFDSKSVNAEFSENGQQAKVEFEGVTTLHQQPEGMISELNSMFLQVRHGLKNGQTKFDFYMQTSDSIDHHFFEVKAQEVIETQFGSLTTVRLDQIKVKNRALSIWYAPELDMQMVKFHYERKMVDLRGELTQYSMK